MKPAKHKDAKDSKLGAPCALSEAGVCENAPLDRKEYLREYHAEHKQDEAFYKERQRARDQLVMFHVRRNMLPPYLPLPESIALDVDRVERMRKQLAEQIAEPVEVEES